MNTSKTIILSVFLLLLPLLAIAQKGDTWRKIYVVSTGDTTRVVNTVNAGLKDPSSKFLFKKSNPVVDSIYGEMKSNYNSLEEATLDINSLLSDLERDQTKINTKENSLSYRLSNNIVENIKKEKAAKYVADSILAYKKASLEELASEYVGFENRPTYYINGVEVGPEVVNQLMPGDIVERELKVQKVGSGNPNGEVWFLVTNKAAQRIKIPLAANSVEKKAYNSERKIEESNYVYKKSNAERANSLEEARKNTSVQSNKQGSAIGSHIPNKVGTTPVSVDKARTDSVSPSENTRKTRVVSRTVNNIEVEVNQ